MVTHAAFAGHASCNENASENRGRQEPSKGQGPCPALDSLPTPTAFRDQELRLLWPVLQCQEEPKVRNYIATAEL